MIQMRIKVLSSNLETLEGAPRDGSMMVVVGGDEMRYGVVQYRETVSYIGGNEWKWTEWQTVPVVFKRD